MTYEAFRKWKVRTADSEIDDLPPGIRTTGSYLLRKKIKKDVIVFSVCFFFLFGL